MARTIAIHSFKGGTGKSTLSANLSIALALKRKKVAVMDMDLEGPGLHVILGLDPYELPFTLNDVLTKGVQPEQAAVKMNDRLHLAKGELYFSPASVKVEEILTSLRSGFEVDSFSNAITKLTEKFGLDYVVVDTHPGLEDDTLLAMSVCDCLLVVTRLDQQDMFGTGVLATVARTLEKPVYLVANMIPTALKTSEVSKVVEKIGSNFKIQVLGWLPFSEDVVNSLSKSVFILDNPNHPMTKRFNELATKLETLGGLN
jgi:MinD-like ATPase involved in chromosome partitioning or flagellar assembly